MSLFVQCGCGEQLEAPEEYAGKQALCPQCSQAVVFPTPPPLLDLETLDENCMALAPLPPSEEPPPPELPSNRRCDDDLETGTTYAMTAEGAAREAQVGTRTTGVVSGLGELGGVRLTPDDATVEFVVFSPDQGMALAGAGESVFVLNTGSSKVLLGFMRHRSNVMCGCFTADGKLALTGDEAGDIIVWDVATGKPIHIFQVHEGPVQHLTCANECALALSCGADGTARLWNFKRGKQVCVLQEDEAQITSASFSRDDSLVVMGTNDGVVHLCETQELKPIQTLKSPPPGRIAAVRFCQEEDVVVAAGLRSNLVLGRQATVTRWQRRHGTAKPRYRHEVESALSNVEAIAIAPNGGSVVFGGCPQQERSIDRDRAALAGAMILGGLAGGTHFRSAPGVVKVESRTLFKVALVEKGTLVHSWPVHKGSSGLPTITSVNISNDGARGISGSTDGCVQLWGLKR